MNIWFGMGVGLGVGDGVGVVVGCGVGVGVGVGDGVCVGAGVGEGVLVGWGVGLGSFGELMYPVICIFLDVCVAAAPAGIRQAIVMIVAAMMAMYCCFLAGNSMYIECINS